MRKRREKKEIEKIISHPEHMIGSHQIDIKRKKEVDVPLGILYK